MANERFLALPAEKQRRLISAGFKVFGMNAYKKASTEEIAREAGISKGYLFYYFHNKKALYLFLYDKAMAFAREQVQDEAFHSITDFFEMMSYAAAKKARLSVDYPYLTEFSLRAFYSHHEDVSRAVQEKIMTDIQHGCQTVLGQLDLSPFRPGVDPVYLMRLMQWMADGYSGQAQRLGQNLSLAEMLEEFEKMMALMKNLSYREEYL